MKILTNGACSVLGDVGGAWPDVLAYYHGHEVTNIALRGSGFDYVLQSTIDAVSKNKYDLVLVMWPEWDRVDVQLNNIQPYENFYHLSKNQIELADRRSEEHTSELQSH